MLSMGGVHASLHGFVVYGGRVYATKKPADETVWLFRLEQATALSPKGSWYKLSAHDAGADSAAGPGPLVYAASSPLDISSLAPSKTGGQHAAYLIAGGSSSSPGKPFVSPVPGRSVVFLQGVSLGLLLYQQCYGNQCLRHWLLERAAKRTYVCYKDWGNIGEAPLTL